MDRVHVGVIGVGGMGTFHALTLAKLADVVVSTVCDPHEPNATAVRDAIGAAVVADPIELIGSGELDGLVIASPDDTHAELTLAAIEQDLPVLCEKPLATTVADASRVLDTEVERGRRLVQVGFMREYDPAHRQVREELAALGDIEYVRAVHRNANATRRTLDLIIGQSMVHDIHTLRHLTGAEITSITASGSGPSNGSFRHIVALCSLSTGGHAVLEFDDGGFAYDVSVEVLTTNGDVVTGPPTRPIRRAAGSIDVHLGNDWFGWFADAYRIQDQAWIDSIRSGVTSGPSAWDGAAAQHVIDAITDSLASGRTVDVVVPERPSLYD